MKRHGNWVIKLLLVLMAALWLSVVAASWSEAAEDSGSEYHFSWLDPDKKVSVLQNRRYQKANRPMVTLNLGLANTSAYRTSYVISPRIDYFFNESWGLEVFYSGLSNKENNTAQALESTSVRPDVIEIKTQIGALLHWIPWYAKINVFNTVLHFDWYFEGGIGSMTANRIPGSASVGIAPSTSSLTAYYLGTGQLYHVSESFVVKLDFLNTWYSAPSRAVTGTNTLFNGTAFTIGGGFLL